MNKRSTEATVSGSEKAALHEGGLNNQGLLALAEMAGSLMTTQSAANSRETLESLSAQADQLAAGVREASQVARDLANLENLQCTPVSVTELIDQAISALAEPVQHNRLDFELVRRHSTPDHLVLDARHVAVLLKKVLGMVVSENTDSLISIGIQLGMTPPSFETVPSDFMQALSGQGALAALQISIGTEAQRDSAGDLPADVSSKAGQQPTVKQVLDQAICSLLCRELGWQMNIGGSGYAVTLPVARQDPEPRVISRKEVSSLRVPAAKNAVSDYKQAGQNRPLSILLAEDSEINRLVLQAQLGKLGYRADTVANGEEVLRALNARPYDVVLMDIQMPVLDGVETTRRIRSLKLNTQPFVVAVTGSEYAEDQGRFRAAGINGYIPKPVDLDALGAILADAWGMKHEAGAGSRPALQDSGENELAGDLDLQPLYQQLGAATDELLRRVIPVFIREMPGRREALLKALENQDSEAFSRICHSLKGSSRSVGATELADEFARLEKLAYEAQLPSLASLNALLLLASRSIKSMQGLLKKLEAVSAS